MRGIVKYVVQGNAKLRELAAQDELLSVLSEPIVISSPEGGCRNMTTKAEYALRAKLFVLLHFATEYGSSEKVREILGTGGVTSEVFDRWWELVRAEDDEPLPDFGARFRVDNVKRSDIAPTGSEMVEEWLNRVLSF